MKGYVTNALKKSNEEAILCYLEHDLAQSYAAEKNLGIKLKKLMKKVSSQEYHVCVPKYCL